MLKGQLALTATRPTAPVLSGGDTQPPSVPTGLRATAETAETAETADSIALSWTASTDNVAVAGYSVHQVTGSGSTLLGSAAATAYDATGLAASTSYTFSVSAYDAAGNTSAASAAVTSSTTAAANTNLALNQPTSASGYTQNYVPANAVDGNSSTYWESTDNAFPQWLQVDLGSAVGVSRIVLDLPPLTAWATRTQTLSVLGSTDGSTFGTVVGSAGYTFDPATGNTVTITFASAQTRYLRLSFTGNDGWPAGQVSEFQVYGS